MILHVAVDVECWVSYSLDTDSDMSLFNEHNCLLHSLSHLKLLKDDRESPTAESSHVHLLCTFQSLS